MANLSQQAFRSYRGRAAGSRPLPRIFFCADPHGQFDYLNEAALRYKPDAMVLLGDMQAPKPLDELLAAALIVTEIWWIPGNHDSDTEEFYDNLWKSKLADHKLNGRVDNICGLRIAGLGGVFRGQVWMPDGSPNYYSAASFIRRIGKGNLWRGGLPRRHRTTIFPSVYENLSHQRADILVTHEAPACHPKGFEAIDRLAKNLHVHWLFHGHQHEDRTYGTYKGMLVRGVGYRGIVDLQGRVVVPAQLDPRDQLAMQEAGEEPPPEILDSVSFDAPTNGSVKIPHNRWRHMPARWRKRRIEQQPTQCKSVEKC